MSRMIRLLKEPTVHFAVIGGALFLIFELVNPDGAADAALRADLDAHRIVVTESLVSGLSQDYLRRTGSPPTEDTLRGLIQQYIDDEVLVREARALGLDRGDPVVRRRLRQRMAFVIEDGARAEPPSDAELRDLIARHPERYDQAPRITFEHVFIARERVATGSGPSEDLVEPLLARLAAGGDPAELGDPFITGNRFTGRTEQQLGAAFGPDFASRVMALPRGEWRGPIASSFGYHLVRVDERQAGGPPELDAVRPAVTRDWWSERRRRAQTQAIARFRANYLVEVEGGVGPLGDADGATTEAAVGSGGPDGVGGVASWTRPEVRR